jgi:hypothetical protein
MIKYYLYPDAETETNITSSPRRRTRRVLTYTSFRTVTKSLVQYITKLSKPSALPLLSSNKDLKSGEMELDSGGTQTGSKDSSVMGYFGGFFNGGPTKIRNFCKSGDVLS